jgi:hypothetical protein
MATTTEKLIIGTETVLMTPTNLSALANNALFLSAAYNNVQGGGAGDGYTLCRVKVAIEMAVAAAANTGVSVWFLKSQDGGTTYESGGTAYTPLRVPDLIIPAPVDTTQRFVMRDVLLPAGFVKVLLKNDATGQALATDTTATGSSLGITPITRQSV